MATPENKLPSEMVEPGVKDADGTRDGARTIQPEKATGTEEQKSLKAETNDIPIVYHYLIFETGLPSPTYLGPTRDGSSPPEPPDLRNYVSPFTWSSPRKTFTTSISCLITVVTAYAAGSYAPASEQMSKEWGVSQIAVYVGITTFTTGFAIAPMVLAPFSELNGRKPVFVVTGILFVICQLCCAVTRSFPGMLVARFFAGVGGSTFSTMVGGVVSDIYNTEGILSNSPSRLFVSLTKL